VAPAAAVVEVVKAEANVVEDEDWAAARVKPRATTRVVSCMVVRARRHGRDKSDRWRLERAWENMNNRKQCCQKSNVAAGKGEWRREAYSGEAKILSMDK
jgi:hypothetical protein